MITESDVWILQKLWRASLLLCNYFDRLSGNPAVKSLCDKALKQTDNLR